MQKITKGFAKKVAEKLQELPRGAKEDGVSVCFEVSRYFGVELTLAQAETLMKKMDQEAPGWDS